jgi:hypothetical protein
MEYYYILRSDRLRMNNVSSVLYKVNKIMTQYMAQKAMFFFFFFLIYFALRKIYALI